MAGRSIRCLELEARPEGSRVETVRCCTQDLYIYGNTKYMYGRTICLFEMLHSPTFYLTHDFIKVHPSHPGIQGHAQYNAWISQMQGMVFRSKAPRVHIKTRWFFLRYRGSPTLGCRVRLGILLTSHFHIGCPSFKMATGWWTETVRLYLRTTQATTWSPRGERAPQKMRQSALLDVVTNLKIRFAISTSADSMYTGVDATRH